MSSIGPEMISGVRASSIRIEFDLVDDRVVVALELDRPAAELHHRLARTLHVVAQIVEPEFVVGAVGDVGGVLGAADIRRQVVDDAADFEAEEPVDLPHPLAVALGEIVVDGDDVDTATGERIEVDWQRRDQGLAFTRLHFRDLAVVQHHAADQLDIEVALAKSTLGGLAHGGEGFDQQVVEVWCRRRSAAFSFSVCAFNSASRSFSISGSIALMAATRAR